MRLKAVVLLGLAALCGCGDADAGRPAEGAEEEARARVYVDVRTPAEFASGHMDGAVNIPQTEIAERWRELEPYREDSLIVYCRTGRRSALAIEVLRQQGFEHIRNGGGLDDVRNGR